MTTTQSKLMTYPELLDSLSGKENHLLLGNGFNLSLGIRTRYEDIFAKMKDRNQHYHEIDDAMKTKEYDVEVLLAEVKQLIKPGDESEKGFLERYSKDNIKLDFMMAASAIVAEKIKDVYQNDNKNLVNFFKNFDKFFTLNNDTFLYLLLMFLKKETPKSEKKKMKAAAKKSAQKDVYTLLSNAKKNGFIEFTVNGEVAKLQLSEATKTQFQTIMDAMLKKGDKYKNEDKYKYTDTTKLCDWLWAGISETELKPDQGIHNVDDGFYRKQTFKVRSQNVFFLHGSFHIYQEGSVCKKMKQSTSKALHGKLEEKIKKDGDNVVCVFSGTSAEKKKQIEGNVYLKRCLEALSEVSGNIVIFGSSLAKNDSHIFDAINASEVTDIYISSCSDDLAAHTTRAQQLFAKNNKNIHFFDYNTFLK